MGASSKQNMSFVWRKAYTVFLALTWFCGLVAGFKLYSIAGTQFNSLMRGTLGCSVSIISLLCVTFLPFLFSAFAVYISEPRIMFLVCFGKAIAFSLTSLCVTDCFGASGWLVRFFLMFSDIASVPLLYFFWQRYISGCRKLSFSEFAVFLSLNMLIGSIDYCLISPFWGSFIHF